VINIEIEVILKNVVMKQENAGWINGKPYLMMHRQGFTCFGTEYAYVVNPR